MRQGGAVSDARENPDGTWSYVVDRPPGWSRLAWLAVCALDAVFHHLAYGRLHIPGLARLEHRQPLRGWCDAVTGISPQMRASIDALGEGDPR